MHAIQITNTHDRPIPVGSHDDLQLIISYFNNAYTTKPTEFSASIKEFKGILIEAAMLRHAVKENAPAISPSKYQNNAAKRTDALGVSRHFMILDFDNGPDLDFIQKQLSDFLYFMWTTHSHQMPNKGPRYRVFLPFDTPISYQDWSQEYHRKFMRYFETMGFVGQNMVDKSAFKFGQLAFLPGINPEIGFVDLWFNDGKNTQVFTLELLPVVEKMVEIPVKEYKPLDWHPENDEIEFIVNCLLKKPELNQIESSPTAGDNGFNRKTVAAALQSIGASYGDFAQLDQYMKMPTSQTDSAKAWKHATLAKVSKHPGILYKLLTPLERKLCRIP